jgi:alpha-D-xyloside xylohydrolase
VLPLEIRHYGEKEGTFALYDDDGETFDYEKGNYVWYTLTASKNKKGKIEGKVIVPSQKTPQYKDYKWKWM